MNCDNKYAQFAYENHFRFAQVPRKNQSCMPAANSQPAKRRKTVKHQKHVFCEYCTRICTSNRLLLLQFDCNRCYQIVKVKFVLVLTIFYDFFFSCFCKIDFFFAVVVANVLHKIYYKN